MKIHEIYTILSNSYDPAYLDWYMHQTEEKHPEIEGHLEPVLDLYGRDYCVGALDMFFAIKSSKETRPAGLPYPLGNTVCDCGHCENE